MKNSKFKMGQHFHLTDYPSDGYYGILSSKLALGQTGLERSDQELF
jgi:hypothetical protein